MSYGTLGAVFTGAAAGPDRADQRRGRLHYVWLLPAAVALAASVAAVALAVMARRLRAGRAPT